MPSVRRRPPVPPARFTRRAEAAGPGHRPAAGRRGAQAAGQPFSAAWFAARAWRRARCRGRDRERSCRGAAAAGAAAAGQPAVAAFDGQPEQHRRRHCRPAGRPGRRTPGGAEPSAGCSGRTRRGRPQGRRLAAVRAGLAERQGTGADPGRRQDHGEHRADRRQGGAQLGDLQRRPQHHRGLPAARRLGSAQPGQRPQRAAQPDPGADQGRRHGDAGQPQRRGVFRQQPGGRAQPDGGGGEHLGRTVPSARLYYDNAGSRPTFTDAAGAVRVEQGAQLRTAAPSGSTRGGGYVLLLGSEVDNAGSIVTPKGQTVLSAGDNSSSAVARAPTAT